MSKYLSIRFSTESIASRKSLNSYAKMENFYRFATLPFFNFLLKLTNGLVGG